MQLQRQIQGFFAALRMTTWGGDYEAEDKLCQIRSLGGYFVGMWSRVWAQLATRLSTTMWPTR
jgi:hypothetical protein